VALTISPAITSSPATATCDCDRDQGDDVTSSQVANLSVASIPVVNDSGRNDGCNGGGVWWEYSVYFLLLLLLQHYFFK